METKEHYQEFIFNVGGKIRYEKLEGIDYLVAPASMMLEGVWEGNDGPIYYPDQDLKKSAPVWNHKPLVASHPDMNGKSVSACTPEMIESRKCGLVLNTTHDTKLKTECWFDIKKTEKVEPRIIPALKKGQKVNVSTGLQMDRDFVAGEFKGKKYESIAHNHRPDHLAVLVDRLGACSVDDGAGLLVNEAAVQVTFGEWPKSKEQFEAIQNAFIESLSEEMFVTNKSKPISHQDIARGITTAMVSSLPEKSYGYWDGYIEDVYDNFFVYSKGRNEYAKRDYSVSNQGAVTVESKETPVQRHVEYRTSEGKTVAVKNRDMSGSGVKKMISASQLLNERNPTVANEQATKDTLTATIIANKRNKLTAEMLKGMDIPQLQAIADLATPEPTPTPTPVVSNEKPIVLSRQQIWDAMDPDMKAVFNHGQAAIRKERETLTATIVANKNNRFTPEQLKEMDPNQLQAIAALAAPPERTTHNYGGAWGADGEIVVGNNKPDETLDDPVWNWAPEEKKAG